MSNPQSLELSLGTGFGIEWEDGSGGEIVFTIVHPSGYSSTHKVRVRPFDSTGAYTSPPGGIETNIGQTADNLMQLLKPCYDASTAASVLEALQTQSDQISVAPFSYSFSGSTSWAAGTATGAAWDTWVTARYVGLDTLGGRWALELPGVAQAVLTRLTRAGIDVVTGALKDLGDYLSGQTNGTIHAAKTAIVSHAGNPLKTTMQVVGSTNKRLRRHFHVA